MYTYWKVNEYSKGTICYNLHNWVAPSLTFSPFVIILTSLEISMADLTVLHWIFNLWKRSILPTSIPVGPAGITTSHGDKTPVLAGIEIFSASIFFFKSKYGSSEKIKPTFNFI